jgi:hypothetical protein
MVAIEEETDHRTILEKVLEKRQFKVKDLKGILLKVIEIKFNIIDVKSYSKKY